MQASNDGVREGFLKEVTCQLDLENTVWKSRGRWGFIAGLRIQPKKGGGGNEELGRENISEGGNV